MSEPIRIRCQEVWQLLSDYIENQLSPKDRKSLAEHFRTCAHCTAILDGTRNVIELSCDGRSFTVPTGFSQRLERRLKAALARR
ncbi:MAG TPA: zf-HC2 domain-containing protein [Terriglobales bacterium]|nr:zf-HC2 domain-containing protein [Terriglobales bacterium]